MKRTNTESKSGHRTERIEADLRQTVGNYLLVALRTELPGLVSITRVISARDLRQAKVLFTVMGADGTASAQLNKETLAALQAHAPEIQQEVNRRLRLKFCPRLTFFHDDGFNEAMRIEGILNELSKSRTGEA